MASESTVAEERIKEIAVRHTDLVSRLVRMDADLARRTMAGVVHAADGLTFAQACGERALILRADAETIPWHRDVSTGGLGRTDLRPAFAFTLDLMAGRYPEADRLHPRFKFEVDPPSSRCGRGVMDLMAWQFERVFTDGAGQTLPGFSDAVIDQVAAAMRRPQPVEFFDLIRTDIAMRIIGVRLYESESGEVGRDRLTAFLHSFHPDAVRRVETQVIEALAMMAGPAMHLSGPGLSG